jgi:hypothetical protein
VRGGGPIRKGQSSVRNYGTRIHQQPIVVAVALRAFGLRRNGGRILLSQTARPIHLFQQAAALLFRSRGALGVLTLNLLQNLGLQHFHLADGGGLLSGAGRVGFVGGALSLLAFPLVLLMLLVVNFI